MATKKKAKTTMSPEARAAASERMKKLNEAKKAKAVEVEKIVDAAEAIIEIDEPEKLCDHDWLPGQYKGHEHGGLQLTDLYCPKCDTWKPVKH